MSNTRFLGMANHFGPFPEDSDGPEGQEQPVRTVGGQGELHGVTRLPSLLEMHFLNPLFWVRQIIWDCFQKHQIDLNGKNSQFGLYEVKENFRE